MVYCWNHSSQMVTYSNLGKYFYGSSWPWKKGKSSLYPILGISPGHSTMMNGKHKIMGVCIYNIHMHERIYIYVYSYYY